VSNSTVTVTVNPTPATPTISAGGPASFCAGGSVILTSSATDGNQWFKDGVAIADATGESYAANASGSYTVIFTDVNGCTSALSAPLAVTQNALPATPVISPAGPTTFCSGGNVILVSSSPAGNQWYKDGAAITGANGPTLTATVSGNYTVIITNGTSCVSPPSLPVNVKVNPLPTIQISPSTTTIFAGNSINLTTSGASTYTWSPGTGLSGTTGSLVTASPIVTTTYTVTGTDTNTCMYSTNVVVAVTSKPPPLVIISSGPDTICVGSSVTLTASGANTYNWSPSAGLSDTASATVIAKPTITTTYTVTGTDNFGGVSTATITVKVNPLPDITVTPNPAKIFVGDAVQLKASGANSYLWTPSRGLNDTTKSIVTANPTTTTTYFVSGTDGNGCVGIDTVLVNVFPKPQVKVTPSSATICKGGSVRLTASGASTYSWHPSAGLAPTNTSIVTAFPTVTTTYTVIGTDVNGGVDSTTVTVNVTGQLAAPIVKTGSGNANSLTFQWEAVSGAAGYQVSLDSGATYINPSSGFSGLTHTVTGLALNQTVVIWVKAVGDCESQATRYAGTTGNFEFFVPNAFTPNDDGKNDVLLIYGPTFQSVRMRIFNQWGQMVYETAEQQKGWDGKMNGVKQPSGVYAYYLEVVMPDGRKQIYKGSVTLIR